MIGSGIKATTVGLTEYLRARRCTAGFLPVDASTEPGMTAHRQASADRYAALPKELATPWAAKIMPKK
jgi:hypothetical protein